MPAVFDASPFVKELGRVFGEYRQYNTRSNAVLLNHTADRLAGDLFNSAAALRSSQQSKIASLPAQLGYRIKRRLARNVGSEHVALATFKKGKRKGQFKSQSIASQIRRAARGARHITIEQEIRLRQRFAAVFQASGWLYKGAQGAKSPRVMEPPAVVVKKLVGENLTVTLTNPRPNSGEFAASTGYLEPAFEARIEDMRGYIERKINEESNMFSQPRPNFAGANVEAAVERAMAGGR
jgi:hypothetical protein